VRKHRPQRRLPLPVRLVLAALVLALGGLVVLNGSGALDGAAGRVGAAFGGLVSGVMGAGSSPTPAPTPIALAPPTLERPPNRYTNEPSLDLTGHLPSGMAGTADATIRVYVAGELVEQVPVPRTTDFVVSDVPLPSGWSEVTASIVGPDGVEGPVSEAVHVSFDDLVPPLEIASPASGATMNGETVTVSGTTQGGSHITIRNATTGGQAQGDASTEGVFEVKVPVEKGANALTVSTTDPAGNTTSAVLSVVRGDGEVTAELKVSPARLSLDSLPQAMTVTLTLLDPDGKPIDDAAVTFTISPPGLPTETFAAVTTNGEAVWPDVTIPRDGATEGGGFVTVSVELPEDGKVIETTEPFSIN
jgi:hypothetical protein